MAELEAISHYSVMQLYRDFYSVTGHAFYAYIKKRRLSNALAMVKHSDLSFTDIACICGYSSHQNFSKIVKLSTGVSPTEYKKSDLYFYFSPYYTDCAGPITVKKAVIPPVICVRYYSGRLTGIENRALACLFRAIPDFNGKIYGRAGKQKNSQFCYELCLTNAEQYIPVLENCGFGSVCRFPGFSQLFAMMTSDNTESAINSSWNFLYNHWLQSSMFVQTEAPYFEEYLLSKQRVKKLKLYLPIEKRTELFNIHIKSFEGKKVFLSSEEHGYCAETRATDVLVNFIRADIAFLQKKRYQILTVRKEHRFICAIPAEQKRLSVSSLKPFIVPAGTYAVLACECCNDYSVYEGLLTCFLSENGLKADAFPIFAIYETENGFDDVKLKLYCKIQNVNAGKASGQII